MLVIFGSAGHHSGWTKNVLNNLISKTDHVFIHVKNKKEMRLASNNIQENGLIIVVGWGWRISSKVTNKHNVFGLHPSDLPDYAGGTPMQHQIISGIEKTKMSMYEVKPVYDSGDIIGKCNLSLSGGITDIFKNLEIASTKLILDFLKEYPNHKKQKQQFKENHKVLKRLQHEDGLLSKTMFQNMNSKSIYNFIRCREDPYPNTYFEDDMGIVLFKKVEYISKSEKDKL